MKILQIITSLSTGGAEKLLVDMVPRISARGHDVDVLVFKGGPSNFRKQLESKHIRVLELSRERNVYNPLNIIHLVRFIKHYDIIHTHNTAPQLFTAICSLFSTIKLVTTEHSTSNRRRHLKWYIPIDKWMYSRYRSIICISDAAKNNLSEYLGDNTNITTIYNGIDLKYMSQVQPDTSLCKKKCIITMVAGFRYEKDQDTLIRAMTFLPNKENYELWLIGDGERRTFLENLVKELKIESLVLFWGIRNDVPILLKSSDIIVMSSHFEGLSLSNIEGMSVGKPFIASDVDGLREVTQGAGLLFPHKDARTLAKLIYQLSSDNSFAKDISEACLIRANQYDINKTVDNYLKIYSEIMS